MEEAIKNLIYLNNERKELMNFKERLWGSQIYTAELKERILKNIICLKSEKEDYIDYNSVKNSINQDINALKNESDKFKKIMEEFKIKMAEHIDDE